MALGSDCFIYKFSSLKDIFHKHQYSWVLCQNFLFPWRQTAKFVSLLFNFLIPFQTLSFPSSPLCPSSTSIWSIFFSLVMLKSSNYCQVSYCLGIWSLFLLFIEKFYFKTFSLFIIIHLCLFLFIVQFNFYRVYKVGFISFLYNRKTQNNSGINIIEFSGEVV